LLKVKIKIKRKYMNEEFFIKKRASFITSP
jgi:hypothetical protein